MDVHSTARFEEIRAKVVPVLQPYGLEELALFGSLVRGEDTPESDIDILVQFQDPPKRPLGLLTWNRLERELTERCGRKVDLVSARGLNRRLRPYVQAEKVVLYEEAR
ncbi:MAG: nucleotidyltransferase family protein [Chloroflexi bacterium]|nr:nucleotidyltransferase family protein [Chloroflexota bacterium]